MKRAVSVFLVLSLLCVFANASALVMDMDRGGAVWTWVMGEPCKVQADGFSISLDDRNSMEYHLYEKPDPKILAMYFYEWAGIITTQTYGSYMFIKAYKLEGLHDDDQQNLSAYADLLYDETVKNLIELNSFTEEELEEHKKYIHKRLLKDPVEVMIAGEDCLKGMVEYDFDNEFHSTDEEMYMNYYYYFTDKNCLFIVSLYPYYIPEGADVNPDTVLSSSLHWD